MISDLPPDAPRKEPLGSTEASVGAHPPPQVNSQTAGQRDGISLDDHIHIHDGLAQQQVAHQPTDEVGDKAHLVGCLRNAAHQSEHRP